MVIGGEDKLSLFENCAENWIVPGNIAVTSVVYRLLVRSRKRLGL